MKKQAVKVAYFNDNDEALLIRRTDTAPRRAGLFDLPGGLKEAQDEHNAATFGWQLGTPLHFAGTRELLEETGKRLGEPELRHHRSRIIDVGGHIGEILVSLFVASGPEFEPVFTTVHDEVSGRYILEHDQAIWVPRKQLVVCPDLEVFRSILEGL